jgi:hypothetical protein
MKYHLVFFLSISNPFRVSSNIKIHLDSMVKFHGKMDGLSMNEISVYCEVKFHVRNIIYNFTSSMNFYSFMFLFHALNSSMFYG